MEGSLDAGVTTAEVEERTGNGPDEENTASGVDTVGSQIGDDDESSMSSVSTWLTDSCGTRSSGRVPQPAGTAQVPPCAGTDSQRTDVCTPNANMENTRADISDVMGSAGAKHSEFSDVSSCRRNRAAAAKRDSDDDANPNANDRRPSSDESSCDEAQLPLLRMSPARSRSAENGLQTFDGELKRTRRVHFERIFASSSETMQRAGLTRDTAGPSSARLPRGRGSVVFDGGRADSAGGSLSELGSPARTRMARTSSSDTTLVSTGSPSCSDDETEPVRRQRWAVTARQRLHGTTAGGVPLDGQRAAAWGGTEDHDAAQTAADTLATPEVGAEADDAQGLTRNVSGTANVEANSACLGELARTESGNAGADNAPIHELTNNASGTGNADAAIARLGELVRTAPGAGNADADNALLRLDEPTGSASGTCYPATVTPPGADTSAQLTAPYERGRRDEACSQRCAARVLQNRAVHIRSLQDQQAQLVRLMQAQEAEWGALRERMYREIRILRRQHTDAIGAKVDAGHALSGYNMRTLLRAKRNLDQALVAVIERQGKVNELKLCLQQQQRYIVELEDRVRRLQEDGLLAGGGGQSADDDGALQRKLDSVNELPQRAPPDRETYSGMLEAMVSERSAYTPGVSTSPDGTTVDIFAFAGKGRGRADAKEKIADVFTPFSLPYMRGAVVEEATRNEIDELIENVHNGGSAV